MHLQLRFNKAKFDRTILNALVWLVLIRGTDMGFGYPSHQDMIGSIQYGPQKVMQAIVFLLLLLFILVRGKSLIGILKPTPLMTTFIGIVVLSTIFSESFFETLRFVVLVTTIFLPLYLYSRFYGSQELYNIFLTFCVYVVMINFVYTIAFPQYGMMTGLGQDGAWRGMFVHKNVFGGFTVVATGLFFYHGFILKNQTNFYYKLAFLVGLLSILMCKSATAIVLTTLFFSSFIFLSFLSRQSGPKRRTVYFLLFLFISVSILSLINAYLDDILAALGKDPTLTGRTELWEVLFNEIHKNPLLGFGLGHFTRPEVMFQFSVDFGWVAKSSHNSFLDLLLGIGWFGFGCFIYLFLAKLISLILFQKSSIFPGKIAMLVSCVITIICYGFSSSNVILSPTIMWIITLILIFTLYDFPPIKNKKNLDS